jgi:hypothetical protein
MDRERWRTNEKAYTEWLKKAEDKLWAAHIECIKELEYMCDKDDVD